jgi:hypothetical protein
VPCQVVKHLLLHLLDLGAIAAGHVREHLRARCDTQLREDALKTGNPFLGRLHLMVGVDHATISPMP